MQFRSRVALRPVRSSRQPLTWSSGEAHHPHFCAPSYDVELMSLFEHPKAVAVLLITAKPFQNCDAESLRGRHKNMASWQEASVCIHANVFHIQHFFTGTETTKVTLVDRICCHRSRKPLVDRVACTCLTIAQSQNMFALSSLLCCFAMKRGWQSRVRWCIDFKPDSPRGTATTNSSASFHAGGTSTWHGRKSHRSMRHASSVSR